MQIDFFEIEVKPEPQKMVLPWPLKFCAFNIRGGMVRIYYAVMPRATEQMGTFYCVKTEQDLPETFAARCIGSVFPLAAQTFEADEPDAAVHVFFQMPVKTARKPHPAQAKKGGGENGDS